MYSPFVPTDASPDMLMGYGNAAPPLVCDVEGTVDGFAVGGWDGRGVCEDDPDPSDGLVGKGEGVR